MFVLIERDMRECVRYIMCNYNSIYPLFAGNCKQNDPVKSAAPSMDARLETKRGCRLDVGQEVASKEQLSFQRGFRERWC